MHAYANVWTGPVVVTNLTRRGAGTEADPIRFVREVWTMEGEKIAEWDYLLMPGAGAPASRAPREAPG